MQYQNEIEPTEFKSSLETIYSSEISDKKKLFELGLLYSLLIEDLTNQEQINFTTLFSRIVFLRNLYSFSPKEMYLLQTLRQIIEKKIKIYDESKSLKIAFEAFQILFAKMYNIKYNYAEDVNACLLYTSPSPRDSRASRMPSSA